MDRENKGREYTGDMLKRALSSATTGTDDEAGPSTREPATYSSDGDSEGPGLGDIVAIVLQETHYRWLPRAAPHVQGTTQHNCLLME